MNNNPLKLHLLVVWLVLVCSLLATGFLLKKYISSNEDLNKCASSMTRAEEQVEQTRKNLQRCKDQNKSLREASSRLTEHLATQRAMPRGSLGNFYLAYDRFASALRFEVELRMEYQVSWKPEEKAEGLGTKVLHAQGRKSVFHGVYLGRRSNFAFGLLVVPDDDVALRVPAGQSAFKPPEPGILERKYWVDKEVEYVPDDPHIVRVLKLSITKIGNSKVASPLAAKVVRLWRQEDKAYSVMVLGTPRAADGIDPGPPYLSEKNWLSSLDGIMLYPMTEPNGGIVLYKEDLSKAYARDRELLAEQNTSLDYYRAGWLRADWDCVPGSIQVLFAPLPAGQQKSVSPLIHSLIFPLMGRRAFWLPFWSIRERFLAPQKTRLESLPAYDIESQVLPLRLSGLPTKESGQWDESAFQSAFYDLLKRKSSVK